MNKFMLSLALPIVITSAWFPLFDTRAEVVPLRDWSPVISTQLMAVSFVEEEVKPDIPDLVPNEDPAKCPCKGTGKITHGDGHQTDCPFHGEGGSTPNTYNDKDALPKVKNEIVIPWEDQDLTDDEGPPPVFPSIADEVPHKCKCDTAETYCNCIEVHGKCSCAARDPSTESQDSGKSPRRNRRSRLFKGRT